MNPHNPAAEPPHDLDAEQAVLGACMTAPAVVTHVRAVLPDPTAFYRPAHQIIYAALLRLADGDDGHTDPVALKDQLTRAGLLRNAGGGDYLFQIYQSVPIAADPAYHAQIVARHDHHRRGLETLTRAQQRLHQPDLDEPTLAAVLEQARDDLDKAAHDTHRPARHVRDVDQFLAADTDDDTYDWVVPGFLERHDRLILTGEEGKGKSTLLRQIAVQAAAGIHPFTGEVFDPIRVLYLDLENSERQFRRKIRPLRIKAGDALDADRLRIEVRLAGIDLTQPADVAWFLELAAAVNPDLLITGPVYKMATGDPTEEKSAKPVAMALDRVRDIIGCALLLEAHAPKRPSGQRNRPHEPYGWSGWLRWPEFGLWLDEDGTLDHWRGDRDEREWPSALRRGGDWPWTPETSDREILWRRIKQIRAEFGQPMSYRDLADTMKLPLTQIQRAIGLHKDQWLTFNGEES